eukprot:EG_transcript_20466
MCGMRVAEIWGSFPNRRNKLLLGALYCISLRPRCRQKPERGPHPGQSGLWAGFDVRRVFGVEEMGWAGCAPQTQDPIKKGRIASEFFCIFAIFFAQKLSKMAFSAGWGGFRPGAVQQSKTSHPDHATV